MSTLLPPVDLTGAIVGTQGTVSLSTAGTTSEPWQFADPPKLQIFNESGLGLLVQTLTEGHTVFCPAGSWREISLTPGESGILWQVIYQLGNPPVSTLILVYYTPGEYHDEVGTLGNSPIQGSQQTSSVAGAAFQLNGSAVADATLPLACDFSTAVGGVETSKTSTITLGNGLWCEVTSQGNATGSALPNLPTSPSGRGWAFTPGAGSFAAGLWSLVTNLSFALLATGATGTVRFWRYSNGAYFAIGSILTNLSGTAKAVRSWPATSMGLTTFLALDILYVDLFVKNGSGTALGMNPTVFESTTTANGVVNDMQVKTPNFG